MTDKYSTTLHSDLEQFGGSEEWTILGPLFPRFLVSEGARYLAENAGAWWLLEAIASHLISRKWRKACQTNRRLAEMSFWTLTKSGDSGAILEGQEDSNIPPVVKQVIEYTDFPFPRDGAFRLYVGNDGPGTYEKIFLPSEY